MSKIQGGTIKERLARLEVLLCNHIAHHEKVERWMLRIGTVIVGGLTLQILPDLIKWVASVL